MINLRIFFVAFIVSISSILLNLANKLSRDFPIFLSIKASRSTTGFLDCIVWTPLFPLPRLLWKFIYVCAVRGRGVTCNPFPFNSGANPKLEIFCCTGGWSKGLHPSLEARNSIVPNPRHSAKTAMKNIWKIKRIQLTEILTARIELQYRRFCQHLFVECISGWHVRRLSEPGSVYWGNLWNFSFRTKLGRFRREGRKWFCPTRHRIRWISPRKMYANAEWGCASNCGQSALT